MKILAVASAGGHWIQLLRLKPAFDGAQLVYVTTQKPAPQAIGDHRCHIVIDANFNRKIRLGLMSLQVLGVLLRERPQVIVSTGAAPGFAALVIGKMLGARTIWIDSIANAEELSLAGRKVSRWADHWLTQWPELANDKGPHHLGAVL
jgi:UDP-N-acetylglucosamine:LPS N-acetylglucosamine transferase